MLNVLEAVAKTNRLTGGFFLWNSAANLEKLKVDVAFNWGCYVWVAGFDPCYCCLNVVEVDDHLEVGVRRLPFPAAPALGLSRIVFLPLPVVGTARF